ncbi:NUDIX domain-containing protein [Candidatus Gracilibacteria bacterium]|nr:NUDIX domain-containing protein [Candidatus Gracilibacteria bacterium]
MYRHSVAAVVINHDKQVLICKRNVPQEHWQFPQGGVNEGESEEQGMLRELQEELGSAKFSLLYKSKHQYRFDWPKNQLRDDGLIGQEQRYYLVLFWGSDSEITLEERSFTDFQWVDQSEVMQLIFPTRRLIYQAVMEEFVPIIKIASTGDVFPP